MAFTEKYVKVQSTRWDTATTYVVNDQCSGSDNKNYYCIKNQSNAEGADPPAAGYDEWWTVSDGTTEVRAWTFAEMIAAAPNAETRVNVKSGNHALSSTTMPANGTATQPIVIRGYYSSIGDLDDSKRGSDGLLTTTNFPDLQVATAAVVPSPYCYVHNCIISGDLSSALFGNATVDSYGFVNCKFSNIKSNSSAGCLWGDNDVFLIDCDFYCTQTTHGTLVNCDIDPIIIGCRFIPNAENATLLSSIGGKISDCVFIGKTGTGTGFNIETQAELTSINHCTFYGLTTAIYYGHASTVPVFPIILTDNYITDYRKAFDSAYAATGNVVILERCNRIRDNTTKTGALVGILSNEITTAGTDDSDYQAHETGNLFLTSTAPGKSAAMMPYGDIGALQRAEPTVPTESDVRALVTYGEGGAQTGTMPGCIVLISTP